MIDQGKHSVLGVLVDAVDYESAVKRIVSAAADGNGFAVTALAVHGTVTAALDAKHRYRLNRYNLVLPDGQPVRWALNWLYRLSLKDRVYGPQLTHRVLQEAAAERLPIYLYGSTPSVIEALQAALRKEYPNLIIAGAEPSAFRAVSYEEFGDIAKRVQSSGARILFAGLGCPRQEIFAFEMRDRLSLPILAVGAAFPFIAGTLAQAPSKMQDYGLEWLFRLAHEPKRLWSRYLLLNPLYMLLLLLQLCNWKFDSTGIPPERELLLG